MDKMHGTRQGTAVVLGASIAGLFAAHVLARSYPRVVLVDRDEVIGTNLPRRGVPQGHHVHGLLASGQLMAEDLIPGLTQDMLDAGVPMGDLGGQLRWFFNGRRLAPTRTGLMVVGGDRAVLESHVRSRVERLPNTEFRQDTDIVSLEHDDAGARITGVRVQSRGGGPEEVLPADLVVDATGRGSRTPVWLESMGYGRVPVDSVKIGLTYTTRRFRLRTDAFGTDVSVNPVATPKHPRGAFLTTLGGDLCGVSLTGVLGETPPADLSGFLEYTRSLPVPDVHEAIRNAEPLGEAVTFRFPASVRRRYERLRRLPAGLAVVGDALCTFNPVYGQGMTMAAVQARVLGEQLAGGNAFSPRSYFRAASRALEPAWSIAVGGDLAFPEVPGRRTPLVRFVNAYLDRLRYAAHHDPRLAEAFLRVIGLVDPPERLLTPGVALRVIRGAYGSTGERAPIRTDTSRAG
ncbi:FAD-dependent oxidoreductase [Nocardiopsis metallicus]|uniref:2-polyprenyl-6-methoxyphenol hydroxylase-like FAD-dependent oxidoreductase n=2 Tax=Nocardiopsis metallicus TaxID=179819 RepID=A0A840W6E1_9ACTN|nr:FAD-dependent oxidoreductase [Nocardiopsis metallicus]MBB5490913.1 2-polyprenyl-6-methoxyphenol hydroxylase-like FAD-dependent oxidoreductase [Nocardiopsis metallicus]